MWAWATKRRDALTHRSQSEDRKEDLSMNVVFLIYRRPDPTARVFAEIRKARPERLFLVADGPKNEEERPLCTAARAMVEQVDWPDEVLKNYSVVGLGCRKRVSSGLDWVLGSEELL